MGTKGKPKARKRDPIKDLTLKRTTEAKVKGGDLVVTKTLDQVDL